MWAGSDRARTWTGVIAGVAFAVLAGCAQKATKVELDEQPPTGADNGVDDGTDPKLTPGRVKLACEQGFEQRESECVDIDECRTLSDACDPLTTCTNTPGGFACGSCPSGYAGTGRSGCVDVDECKQNNGGCDALTVCSNTAGGFTCGQCPHGYAGTGKSGCTDIDECKQNNGGCDPLAACTNTPGGFTCGACPSGYSGGGETGCHDIDECGVNNGGCDALTTCTNTPGGFTCGACPSGYIGSGATGCVDINECGVNNGGCDLRSTCTNTPGGFTCGACPSGYTGTGSTGCIDIDECAANHGGCDPLVTCTNTSGGHTCGGCPSGYTGGGATGCVDIDECAVNNGGCDALTSCTNTPGGFTCDACPSGYTGTGATSCVDVDECAVSNGGCDPVSTCTNTSGGFTCGACPSGYTGTGASSCVDVDECASNNGGCDALTTCTNTPGSRACGSCPSGYTGTGASGCVDIDECASNNGGCDALTTCTNTLGGHTCGACPNGYTGGGASGCVDVDECAVNNGGCDPHTTCTNTAGGFTCGACPSGYSGSGATGCIDVNECAVDNGGCDARTTCTNTAGSRICSACPSGYSGTGATGCVDVDECSTGANDCHADATCTNTPGGFTCACNEGLEGDGVTSCSACRALEIGGTVVARPSERPELCIENTSDANAEYVFIPMNLTMGAAYPLTVSATNLAKLTGSAPAAGTAPTLDKHGAARAASTDAYTARKGTAGAGTLLSPASSVPSGVPSVGASWSLNADLETQCTSGMARTGTVRYVGSRSIIVTDDANPAVGLSTADYEEVGTQFDTQVYPSVTGLYGIPSDIDANGRVVLFFTGAANTYSVPGDNSVAHFRDRDLLDQSECPTSNHGEVIYLQVADVTGALGISWPVSMIKGNSAPAAAHALVHMIVDSRRGAAGSPFEEHWLAEGLAAIGNERIFTDGSRLGTHNNITVSMITTGTGAVTASTRVTFFNDYANQSFTAWRTWMQAPSRTGFLDGISSLATRGAGWSFLRYMADRAAAGSTVAEKTFLYDVANASTSGVANLTARIGESPSPWMRDYLASVYIDDSAIPGLDVASLPYRSTTWNYRSMYSALAGFSLQQPVLSAGVPASISLAPGGANYIRFALSAKTSSDISLTPPEGSSWDAWYMILRRQ